MRGLMSRVAAVTGAAVILLAAGGPVTAGVRALSPLPAGSGWSITPTPNPRAVNGLFGAAFGPAVSCPTTSVCTAVGLHVRGSGLGVTLAERRGGGTWTVQSTPNPPGAAASALNGVSCSSGSACTGVGTAGRACLARDDKLVESHVLDAIHAVSSAAIVRPVPGWR
jgi:hypothetical protein